MNEWMALITIFLFANLFQEVIKLQRELRKCCGLMSRKIVINYIMMTSLIFLTNVINCFSFSWSSNSYFAKQLSSQSKIVYL